LIDRNDRQMPTAVNMRDDDLQVDCALRQGRIWAPVARFQRVLRSGFESWTVACSETAFGDFVRRFAIKQLARTVLVIPNDVTDELIVEVEQSKRDDDSSDKFVL
jgi:hypothetical protein